MSHAQSRLEENLPSYADFYRTEYGQAIMSMRPAGRIGATLLEADQPAGDWSDAATPELIICQLMNDSAPVSLDLSAGRFSRRMVKHDFMVAPSQVATKILVDESHRIRVLAIPWTRMRAWADTDTLRLPNDGDFGWLHQTLHQDRRITHTLDAMWRQDDGASAASSLFSDALLIQAVAALVELAHPTRNQPITGLSARLVASRRLHASPSGRRHRLGRPGVADGTFGRALLPRF